VILIFLLLQRIKEGRSETSETTRLSTNWRNPLFQSKHCLHYICQKWQLQNQQETSWNQLVLVATFGARGIRQGKAENAAKLTAYTTVFCLSVSKEHAL